MLKGALVGFVSAVFAILVIVGPPGGARGLPGESFEGCKTTLGEAAVKDLSSVGSCAIAQLAAGSEDPLAIVGACLGATLEGLAEFLDTLLTAGAPPDASAVLVPPDPIYLHGQAARLRVRALLRDGAP